MTAPKKVLIGGGIGLALWGMGYGLYYAALVEHQALDRVGSTLVNGFALAAQQRMPQAQAALQASALAAYDYVRQVDAHGHWIGLSMLLIVIGVAFDRVGFAEKQRLWLALGLLFGAILFPLGVLMETAAAGRGPKAVAIIGSALIILALFGVAAGFFRGEDKSRLVR